MASDGSQKLNLGAFSHLLHHPGFVKTETYGSIRAGDEGGGGGHGPGGHSGGGSNASTASDRTGVWGGPAPRGYAPAPMHAQDADADASRRAGSGAPSAAVNDPPYARLPGGGRLPLIGLGTYQLRSADAVRTALAAGYRHVDCASVYGNQALVGEGLRDFIAEGRREELFVTSKIWNDEHRPEAVRASALKSIEELGCGHLDLLLVHWPHAWVPGGGEGEEDGSVTLAQTWQAMEGLVGEGLVRHLGLSNFGLKGVEEVLGIGTVPPVVLQVELHPLLAQRKLLGVCLRKGVVCTAYSPLGHSQADLLEHPAVLEVAAEAGKTPAQVLLRWNTQRGVAVVPKAGSEGHLRENIEGLFSWRLTWDQKAKLDALDCGHRFVSPAWHHFDDPEEGGALKPSVVLA